MKCHGFAFSGLDVEGAADDIDAFGQGLGSPRVPRRQNRIGEGIFRVAFLILIALAHVIAEGGLRHFFFLAPCRQNALKEKIDEAFAVGMAGFQHFLEAGLIFHACGVVALPRLTVCRRPFLRQARSLFLLPLGFLGHLLP